MKVFDWFHNMGKTKDDRQFELLDERLIDIQGKLRKLKVDQLELAQSTLLKFAKLEKLMTDGFDRIAEAIEKLPHPPGPPAKVGSVKFIFPGLKESE